MFGTSFFKILLSNDILIAALVIELEDTEATGSVFVLTYSKIAITLVLSSFSLSSSFYSAVFKSPNFLGTNLDAKVRETSLRESSRLNICLLEVGTSLSFLYCIH